MSHRRWKYAGLTLVTCLALQAPSLGLFGRTHAAALSTRSPQHVAAAGVTVEMWNPETNPDSIAGLQAVIASFEKTHPNISVHLDNIPWNDIFTKWLAAIRTNTVPDITIAGTTFGITLNQLGALAPLDKLRQQLGPNFFCTCARALVKMNTTPNGHLYAMPFVDNTMVLWYRKDLLQQAHLSVPKTWPQLLHAAQVLTKNGIYGFLASSAKDFVTEQEFYSFMLSNGADIVDRKTGKRLIFDSPQTVQALKFYTELTKYSPPAASSYTRPQVQAAMESGKIAMVVQGSWFGGPLRDDNPALFAKYGTAPVPANPGHTTGAFMGNLDIGVFKHGKHNAQALEFLKYLMQPANYAHFVTADPASYGPVVGGTFTTPGWTNNAKVHAFQQLIRTYRKEGSHAWVYGLPNPYAGTMEGLFTPAEAVQDVVLKKMSPEAAVKATVPDLKKVLHTK